MIKICSLLVGTILFLITGLVVAPPAQAQKSDAPYSGSNKGASPDAGGRKTFKNDAEPESPSGGGKSDVPAYNRKPAKEGPQSLQREDGAENNDLGNDDPDGGQDRMDNSTQDELPSGRKSSPGEVPSDGDDPGLRDGEQAPDSGKDSSGGKGIDTSLGGKKSWSEPNSPEDGEREIRDPETSPEKPARPRLKDMDDGSSIDA
ncbi:MAG: hypothetical protein K8F25_05160 [Fimbriimonadaceae bacterium]|nr:hypothetical protein [Alphaproteobacteria bacterium]